MSEPSMGQVAARFEEAMALHRQGLLKEAEAIYQGMLDTQPEHFGALHMLGVLAGQTGNHRLAADLSGQAIALSPNYAASYYNRGNALRELKQLDAALGSYDRAIAIKADFAEAYSNRGNALYDLKRMDAAAASYERAVTLKVDYAEAYSNRGNALGELKQFDAAVASYGRAIALQADYAVAYSNRGVALMELRQFDAAVASYDRAIVLQADHAEAYSNRGNALRRLKRLDTAVASYDRAIAIRPDFAEAYSNRGVALTELRRLDAAVASCDQAIVLKAGYAEAYYNRGVALHQLRRLDAAIASYDRAIAIKFDYAESYLNKSLVLLLDGDFDRGWPLYEWRWEGSDAGQYRRNFPQPLWLGAEPLSGKTILLHAEQGLGDTIQFCRYAKSVAALGARVVMEVQAALAGLLDKLEGVNELVVNGTPLPAFDYHCPLLSLPLACKTGLAHIPASPAYLRGDRGKVSIWTDRLGAKTRPRVGIAWSGSDTHKNDQNRSIPLSSILPYLPDAFEYVSLQKEVRDIDRAALGKHGNIKHFGNELDDFTDTAALCELMDVVISVDTGVAHLSAALGKRTWILLPYVPDWRWLLDRDDSPWYPSARLYRQDADRAWASVFERVKTDLAALFA